MGREIKYRCKFCIRGRTFIRKENNQLYYPSKLGIWIEDKNGACTKFNNDDEDNYLCDDVRQEKCDFFEKMK